MSNSIKPRWYTRISKIVLILVMCFGCRQSPDAATMERFRTAESEFSDANDSKEFALAAQTYQQVTDRGFVSGRALYNQGNAYAKSNQQGRAIASYRQALRHLPREPKLVANLESTLGKSLELSSDKSLLDYVFLWQGWLSYREKFQLTTLLLVATLILFWCWRWHRSLPLVRQVAIVASALCLVFACSSALDWYRYERHEYGVLVEEVTPRKGNSDNYEPAFTKSLAEGTEFLVLEQRGDWLRATFGDNAEGWIPAESSVTY